MKLLDIFLQIWKHKYPHWGERISYTIECHINGLTTISLTYIDEENEGMYYAVGHISKVIFGDNRMVGYTYDDNGRYIHIMEITI